MIRNTYVNYLYMKTFMLHTNEVEYEHYIDVQRTVRQSHTQLDRLKKTLNSNKKSLAISYINLLLRNILHATNTQN